jgi:hypothetical protein
MYGHEEKEIFRVLDQVSRKNEYELTVAEQNVQADGKRRFHGLSLLMLIPAIGTYLRLSKGKRMSTTAGKFSPFIASGVWYGGILLGTSWNNVRTMKSMLALGEENSQLAFTAGRLIRESDTLMRRYGLEKKFDD